MIKLSKTEREEVKEFLRLITKAMETGKFKEVVKILKEVEEEAERK